MQPKLICFVTLFVGFGFFGGSYLVSSLFYGNGWDNEQAKRFAALGVELHAASFDKANHSKGGDPGHAHAGEPRQFAEIEQEFNAMRARKEAAANSGTYLGAFCYWLGTACILGGAIGLLLVSNRDRD